ncbi:G-protein coupled receptor 182 [Falco biarmicus]|uniref:G-protein coupled receptor 182 n=1 Tax=Falco peregrinus TaxID=8954 RepID=UPI000386F04F|nr:G-protein coupled receptor 182 [Falco peregrinus]XP_027656218.1 G-protein coupled receptor 182 [Falco cherrug]XP_037227089.1 G-protein coupled receptor 182 [Falco rusticolus]XP_056178002.1 G-protein coupled receptor 182 [Falco biarmicus]
MAEVTTALIETHTLLNEYRDYHNWTELFHLLNYTYTFCEFSLDENVKRVVLFILYLVIFVVGLVENLLVIWVNWQTRGNKSLVNLYIINMAIADLGVLLSLPIWMLEVMLDYTWLWGSFLCRFTHYFYFANMYASIFFLTCLSVDRYVSLTSSSLFWRKHQHRARRIICACSWVLAAAIPFLEVAHMQLVNTGEPICIFMAPFETYDEWALAVSLATTTIGFLIPFPIITVFNILTAMFIKSAKPESKKHCLLIYAYIIVFLISWLPFHIMLTLLTLDGNHIILHCTFAHFLYFFYDIIDCFTLLHCVINPILYNFLSKNFRSKLISAVVKYIPKDQGSQKGAGNSSSTTQHSIVIAKDNNPPN